MALVLALAFAALILAGALAVLRGAIAANLVLPVAVGAALRLTVMLAAHFGSVAAGGRGFMFLDDKGYTHVAGLLADRWRDGSLADPASYQFAGSYVFGFPTLVALVFLLTKESLLAAKLVNVLLGTATVLVTALIGRQIGGERAARYTAWLVALSPTVIWWSAPLLKEPLVAFLVAVSVLFALKLPKTRAFVGLLIGLFGLAVTRIPAVLGVGAGLFVAWIAAAWMMRGRVRWSAFAAYSVLGTLLGAAALAFVAHGNPLALLVQYMSTAQSTTAAYPGGDPRGIPGDVVRTALAPYPWAFDAGTYSWYRALYPGMWVWYVLLPTAALGLVRLRRRAELWLFAIPISFLVLASALTSGFTIRQRSSIEPLVLVLVALGVDSWQKVGRRGSAAVFAIALFATLQSHSLVVGAIVASAGILLFLASQLLPRSAVRVTLEPSPLLEGSVAVALPEGISVAAVRARVPGPKPVAAQARLASIRTQALAVVPKVRSISTGFDSRALVVPQVDVSTRLLRRIHASIVAAAPPTRSAAFAATSGFAALPSLLDLAPPPGQCRVPTQADGLVAAIATRVRSASLSLRTHFANAARIAVSAAPPNLAMQLLRSQAPAARPIRVPTGPAVLVGAVPPVRAASSRLSTRLSTASQRAGVSAARRSRRMASVGARSLRALRARALAPKPIHAPGRFRTIHTAMVTAAPSARSASSAGRGGAGRLRAVIRRAAAPRPRPSGRRR